MYSGSLPWTERLRCGCGQPVRHQDLELQEADLDVIHSAERAQDARQDLRPHDLFRRQVRCALQTRHFL